MHARIIVAAILLTAVPTLIVTANQKSASRAAGEDKPGRLDHHVIWSGPKSRLNKTGYHLITSDEKWNKLWCDHTTGPEHRPVVHGTGLPEINFDTCMAIAVFQGESWNSDGVRFVAFEEVGGRLRVRFDDKTYQTLGPKGGGNRVTPFGIVVLPKTSSPVDLEENTQGLIGRPPVWTRRASLTPGA